MGWQPVEKVHQEMKTATGGEGVVLYFRDRAEGIVAWQPYDRGEWASRLSPLHSEVTAE